MKMATTISPEIKAGITEHADELRRYAKTAARLDAWRSVLERTNRIISGQHVTVRVVVNPPPTLAKVSGWSDGSSIYFNGVLLQEMWRTLDPVECVLRLKGLNYHELSHVLFTPRSSDELPKRVRERMESDNDPQWFYSFNALEDQRIESMFTASYGPSRRYFEAMMLQWVIREGTAEGAILIYGRKYLPARIRVQAGKVFVKKYNEDLYTRFKAVIDAYSQIVLPRDSLKALSLVGKYRELLKEMQNIHFSNLPALPVEDNGADAGHGQPSETAMKSGRIDREASQEAAEAAAEQAERADAEAEEVEFDMDSPDTAEDGDDNGDEATDDGDGEGTGKGSKGSGSKTDDGTGDSGGSDDGDGEGGDATPTDTTGHGGDGAGSSGTSDHSVLSEDELEAAMREMIEQASAGIEEILDDPLTVDEAESMLDAVKAQIEKSQGSSDAVQARINQTLTPLSDSLLVVRKIVQILIRVKQEAEPDIHHRQPQGRLDMRRVLNHRPGDFDIFRAYDNGTEEETGIEAVISMDVSGSMGSNAVEASKAVWTLKRSFDKVGDIRTTVLVYDTQHYTLYQPDEKAPARIQVVNTSGGTNPLSTLEEANNIFSRSHRPNLLMVNVTDGQWPGNPVERGGLMKNMRRMGVHSMLLGLGNAVERYGKLDHDIAHDLSGVNALPNAVTKVVEAIIRNNTLY